MESSNGNLNTSPLLHYEDYETNILGCILRDGKLIDRVKGELHPRDFYTTSHQVIFRYMLDMDKQNIPIDDLSLMEALKQKGELEIVGRLSYLGYLRETVISDANIGYHIERVKEAATKRHLLEKIEELKKAIEKNADKEVVRGLQNQISLMATNTSLLIKPISIQELEDNPPVESLWGDILHPETIIQVNAEPGVGKTTFFYNLCLYGAVGKEWLGIPFSKTIKSLYIDVETPKRKRKHKLRAICEEEALPRDFYLLDWLDLREDFHNLLALCKKETYDVVVLDTQSRIFGMERENDNSEANQLVGLLRKLVNETGCCVVLIHHTTKGDDSKGVYRGRGASAVAGAVDIVVNMESLDDEVLKITVPKNRIVGTNPVLYLKKAGEDRFEPYTPPEGSSGFELFKAQDFINTLLDNRTYQTDEIYQLGRDKGFSESTTKRALSKLVESGKWERVKKGVYRKATGHGSKSSSIYPDRIDPLTRDENSLMPIPSYLK